MSIGNPASLVIGSRGSKLALWQSHWVKSQLESLYSGLDVRIEIITTTGDQLVSASLPEIGGKGVFTQELEEALVDRRIDLAVHSLKDLPTNLPQGLELVAITEREDARDALLVSPRLKLAARDLEGLPAGARIGTSSLRRASQLRHLRPDIVIAELRGNVETRLRKLETGDYDAIVLATAGLIRLGLEGRIDVRLDRSQMLPAVGQGALGVEARRHDTRVSGLLQRLDHRPTRLATLAERAVLRSLGGGCSVPIAAHAWIEDKTGEERLVVDGLVAEVTGARVLRACLDGPPQEAELLGHALAEQLISAGAKELLDGFKIGQ